MPRTLSIFCDRSVIDDWLRWSVASPISEWRKSAPPKVPVTSGGAGPFGVLIITIQAVSKDPVLRTTIGLPSIADMAKYSFMAHLPECNLAPVTVGR
jgi:hypothetical protein